MVHYWDEIGYPDLCNSIDNSVYMAMFFDLGRSKPTYPLKIPFGFCLPRSCETDTFLQDMISILNFYTWEAQNYLRKMFDFRDLNQYVKNDNSQESTYFRYLARFVTEKFKLSFWKNPSLLEFKEKIDTAGRMRVGVLYPFLYIIVILHVLAFAT